MGIFSFVSLGWLVWMTGTVLFFWASPAGYRNLVLAVATFLFLLTVDPYSCGILSALTLLSYLVARKHSINRFQAGLVIFLIVSVLFSFKWANAQLYIEDGFGVSSIIPLGLSFYSLRCIHFVVERFKGKIGSTSFSSLVSYLFFLPTIWIGPINRFAEFDKSSRRHRWDSELFSLGMERVLYGYVKVVLIGGFFLELYIPQWFVKVLGAGTQLVQYLDLVRGGLSLYVLFSGFSDIAIGFAALLGYRLGENFTWPYFKKNISEFWRSWHISLTSWSRDYVYTYVIAKTRNSALGTVSSLVAIGLWHEISLRYIAWGIYHGIGIIIWQYFQTVSKRFSSIESPALKYFLDFASILLTVHFVWVGFLLVKQPDIESAVSVLRLLILGSI